MATLDLTAATRGFDMSSGNNTDFAAGAGTVNDSSWSWRSTMGHKLTLEGLGMTFDGGGHAVSGRVNVIGIDLATSGAAPDIVISGLNVAASPLDDSADNFWRVLAGNDLIKGADAGFAGNTYLLFGDNVRAAAGSSTGGNDIFQLGTAGGATIGDVAVVGSAVSGTPAVDFLGGADHLTGAATTKTQVLIGDAQFVQATGKLTGGSDLIDAVASGEGSLAIGDAMFANGNAGGLAEVRGGNDTINAFGGFAGIMIGDVHSQGAFARVTGGDDRMDGNSLGTIMIGDVQSGGTEATIGGGDTIEGNGGNDTIVGDVNNSDRGRITGGNDTLDGGSGNDTIYGDVINMNGGTPLVAGNDMLFGGEGGDLLIGDYGNGRPVAVSGGNDSLFGGGGDDGLGGQDGNDLLDGGTGADKMVGGVGDDIYYTDNFADIVTEFAGEGTDTVNTTLNDVRLHANVENLVFIGAGNFKAGGNALSNRITGRDGDDTFIIDGAGNDVFNGLGGLDSLDFRDAGGAMVNFVTNVNGGSAAGDRYFSIERIFGSNAGDDITIGASSAILIGNGGNDVLRGGSQADSLFGGEGNDRLDGGGGNDAFIGGDAGNDVITGGAGDDMADGGAENDILYGQAGRDTLRGGLGNDTLYGGDEVGLGDQMLAGDGGIDFISGGGGNDMIDGGMDNDRYLGGGDGNDMVLGGQGSDRLHGEAGGDVLNGGTQNDNLTGGGGADRFVFSLSNGSDAVFDFVNDVDTLVIDPGFGFANAAAVVAATIQTGNHARILLPGSDTDIYLWNYLAPGNGNTIAGLIDDILIG